MTCSRYVRFALLAAEFSASQNAAAASCHNLL
jgi:hypothetical protein